MASCAAVNNTGPIDPELADKLSAELHECIRKDQLVKAKMALDGLRIEDKKRIVRKTFEGSAPLLIAAQQGLSHFVDYLLTDCHADIEQQGVYRTEDRWMHHVTPLWCAALANKLEVVKILIRHSAEVNTATSDFKTTPLIAACSAMNIDVVNYLISKGAADINKPDINGCTCLHFSTKSAKLCQYLIDNKANVNALEISGKLALHYAIGFGKMETVQLLLKHGSDPYHKDQYGEDALLTAAGVGNHDILKVVLDFAKAVMEKCIDFYELLACYFVDTEDIPRALHYWRHAMGLRYKDKANIIEKPQTTPTAVYQNHKEAATMAELEAIATNPEAIYMQTLIIRERILGPMNYLTLFGLVRRARWYVNKMLQRSIDLMTHAFKLHHNNLRQVSNTTTGRCELVVDFERVTLQSLCCIFLKYYVEFKAGRMNAQFDVINEVLEMSVSKLERLQEHFAKPASHLNNLATDFNSMVHAVLNLINLLCALPKSDNEQVSRFKRTVHRLIKLNTRSPVQGKCVLHQAVSQNTAYKLNDSLVLQLPNEEVVKVMLECGADPTVADIHGNTPLHRLCFDTSNLNDRDRTSMIGILNALLKAGAHADAVNKSGVIATHGISSWYPQYRMLDHLTLQCLAARVVKKFNIPYIDANGESLVPSTLLPFLDMH